MKNQESKQEAEIARDEEPAGAPCTEKERQEAERGNELVPVRLMKGSGKYAEDLFVCVNGRSFLIRRGVEVQLPRYVADVIHQSIEQDENTQRMIDEEFSGATTE